MPRRIRSSRRRRNPNMPPPQPLDDAGPGQAFVPTLETDPAGRPGTGPVLTGSTSGSPANPVRHRGPQRRSSEPRDGRGRRDAVPIINAGMTTATNSGFLARSRTSTHQRMWSIPPDGSSPIAVAILLPVATICPMPATDDGAPGHNPITVHTVKMSTICPPSPSLRLRLFRADVAHARQPPTITGELTYGSELGRVSRPSIWRTTNAGVLSNRSAPCSTASPMTPHWAHMFPINDRDFASVAELLLVPGCPPGLFTKQFVEEPYPGNVASDQTITVVKTEPTMPAGGRPTFTYSTTVAYWPQLRIGDGPTTISPRPGTATRDRRQLVRGYHHAPVVSTTTPPPTPVQLHGATTADHDHHGRD